MNCNWISRTWGGIAIYGLFVQLHDRWYPESAEGYMWEGWCSPHHRWDTWVPLLRALVFFHVGTWVSASRFYLGVQNFCMRVPLGAYNFETPLRQSDPELLGLPYIAFIIEAVWKAPGISGENEHPDLSGHCRVIAEATWNWWWGIVLVDQKITPIQVTD